MLRRGTYIARTGGVMYWTICPATGRQECGGTFCRCRIQPSRTSMSTSSERHVLYRYKTPRQRGAATSPLAQEACGEAAEASCDPIRRLLYRAGSWDQARRVDLLAKVEWHSAFGERVPSSGLHRNDGWPRRSGAFLQWSRDSRAVDQGGEVRAELDSAVVPSVRGQPGASVSVRPSVQPWELPSPAVSAQGRPALVAAERAGSS